MGEARRCKINSRTGTNDLFSSEDEEDMYIDSSDERNLMSMPERERQNILYERHQKVLLFRERKEIDSKLEQLKDNKPSIAICKDEKKKEEYFNFDEFSMLIIRRDFIAQNIYKPSTEKLIGHFIRAKIRETYHIAKIEAIITGDTYSIPLHGKEFKTDKYLVLKTSFKIIEKFSIIFVSNSPIFESEYESVLSTELFEDIKSLRSRHKALITTMHRALTDKETFQVIEERQKFYNGKKRNTILKIQLIKDRDDAIDSGNFERAQSLQENIDAITLSDKPHTDLWVELSKRNKKINIDRDRERTEKYKSEHSKL